MQNVLFACVHNAGRSQMAAALFNARADPGLARATSAGTHPAEHVHPLVVRVMQELGLDLAGVRPRLLTSTELAGAQLLVTLGCGEECPFHPGLPRRDWPLEDPARLPLETVRVIRDEVARRVEALVAEFGWGPAPRNRSAGTDALEPLRS